jgi:hypothetical protein
VAGKGLAAALLMASLRAAVRALWREGDSLPGIVARINENLRQTVPPNRFATLFLARADTATGEVEWVNAGHAPPLVARSDGSHDVLEATGTILGLRDARGEGRTTLGPGDVLVLLSTAPRSRARPRATSASRLPPPSDEGGILDAFAALQATAERASRPGGRRLYARRPAPQQR